MAFTLTYLGTDTVNTPNDYLGTQRGETLSYIASRIQSHSPDLPKEIVLSDDGHRESPLFDNGEFIESDTEDHEEIIEEKDEHTSSLEDSFIGNPAQRIHNGPDTRGYKFYDIMALGVSKIVRAIGHGETTINMVGHSRGAVESIIASHELQRIKNALSKAENVASSDDLLALLCESKHAESKTQLKQYLEPYKDLLFKQVNNLKSDFRLNIFALDPVPGNSVWGSWFGVIDDKRFFHIPPVVQTYRQIILENERTKGFRAILPSAEEPTETNFSLTSLPGHHGTASGNPYDQGANKEQYTGEHTKEVQNITLYELHDFLTQRGVVFDLNEREHKNDLHALFLAYSGAASVEVKDAIKRVAYETVQSNRAEYKRFNQTTYSPLPQENIEQSRILHTYNYEKISLSSVLSLQTDDFVNAEHARLFLRQQFNFDEGKTPKENISALLETFDAQIDGLEKTLDKDKKGELKKAIQGSLQVVLSGFMQTYLRNNLSSEQQGEILSLITATLTLQVAEGSSVSSLVTELQHYLVKGLITDINGLVTSHQEDIKVQLSETGSVQHIEYKLTQMQDVIEHLSALKPCFECFEDAQKELDANISILEASSMEQLIERKDLLIAFQENKALLERTQKELQESQSLLKYTKKELRKNQDLLGRTKEALQESLKQNNFLNEVNDQQAKEKDKYKAEASQLKAINVTFKLTNEQLLARSMQTSKEKGKLDAQYKKLSHDNTALRSENDGHLKHINDLEATKKELHEANVQLERDKTSEEKANAELRSRLDASLAQVETKTQRIATLEEATNYTAPDDLFHGLSLEVLGGFAVALGVAAFTLSLAALMLMPISPVVPIGIALVGAGVATAGFFSMREGIQQQYQEVLCERVAEASI